MVCCHIGYWEGRMLVIISKLSIKRSVVRSGCFHWQGGFKIYIYIYTVYPKERFRFVQF